MNRGKKLYSKSVLTEEHKQTAIYPIFAQLSTGEQDGAIHTVSTYLLPVAGASDAGANLKQADILIPVAKKLGKHMQKLRMMRLVFVAVGLGFCLFLMRVFITPRLAARRWFESLIQSMLFLCAAVAVLTTLGIIFSLLGESLRFFAHVPVLDFLTGLEWSPQTAIREDQAGQSGQFGAIPVLLGTFTIMLVAMLVAAPLGLMMAIYLSEYASLRTRKWVKPIVEVLAGIPTVVYGFFALLTVGPTIRQLAENIDLESPRKVLLLRAR